MRQLFNKSRMIIVFYSAVLTLCTILLSLFFNIGSSDITDRFSDDAVLLEITQDNYSDNALSYSDIADILAKNKARGAMLINASSKGYALFNYSDSDLSYALMNSDDIRSDTPKAVVSTQKLTQTMDIGGKQTINLFSSDHEVIGTDIYSGANSLNAYTTNFAGVAKSTVIFQNITLIADCGEGTAYIANNIRNDIETDRDTIICSVNVQSDVKTAAGGTKGLSAVTVVIVALTGICLILSSGVFMSAWLDSKQSEMVARRICGADSDDIRKLIFLYAVIADAIGMTVGFLLTFIISLIPQVTFYLGSIRLSYGLLIAVILTAVNIVTAYRQSVKYSGKMINSLRRE